MNAAVPSRARLTALSVAGAAAFFGAWTLLAVSGLVQPRFLPTPLAVIETFIELTQKPFVGYTLQQHKRDHEWKLTVEDYADESVQSAERW